MSFTVARAVGGPRALGRVQGEACAEQIAEAIAFYARLAAKQGTSLEELARAAMPYMARARAALPHLVEELEGMAEGASMGLEELSVLNCAEEVWPEESCTSMLTGRFLLHAEQWYAGHSQICVVEARPDHGPAFVAPTCAGLLGAVGMNASGFAQGVDSLGASDDRMGIPRVFVSRLALGAPDLDHAILATQTGPRAGGYAHVLKGNGSLAVIETTATEWHMGELAAHTNHYLLPLERAHPWEPSPGSKARLDHATELLRDCPPEDLEDCARLLSDHESEPEAICLHATEETGEATVLGMACDLESGRMIVSDGNPCAGRWHEFHVPAFASMSSGHVG